MTQTTNEASPEAKAAWDEAVRLIDAICNERWEKTRLALRVELIETVIEIMGMVPPVQTLTGGELTRYGYEDLGKLFARVLTHHTQNDSVARAFDVVCSELAKHMTEDEDQNIGSFIGLDVANPWRKSEDKDGYRRPVVLRTITP